MTCEDLIKELRALGTEQNRKTFARHGVSDECFGVSYRDLGILKKKIKINHELAKELWDTRNHDARVLALMVADAALVDEKLAEGWARDLNNYVLADALASLTGKSPVARPKIEKWTRSKEEWIGSAGWKTLAQLATEDTDTGDGYFEPYLKLIETEIHSSKNRVKSAMNSALIAIGVRNENLRPKAVAVAGKVGKVEVDQGETNCKTPDAVAYIEKALKHREKTAAKKRLVC